MSHRFNVQKPSSSPPCAAAFVMQGIVLTSGPCGGAVPAAEALYALTCGSAARCRCRMQGHWRGVGSHSLFPPLPRRRCRRGCRGCSWPAWMFALPPLDIGFWV